MFLTKSASIKYCLKFTSNIRFQLSKFSNFNHNNNDQNSKKRQRIFGPISYNSLGLAALAGFTVLAFYNIEKDKKLEKSTSEIVNYGKPALGGSWTLVDQDGKVRTSASLKGKFVLIYFGFTFCPDICPNELVKIGKITNQIKKLNKCEFQPIFISVDPNRDSVSQLKYYSKDFHPDILYFTGTKAQISLVTKAYRVYFSKADEKDQEDDDYLVDHSIVLYLVSPSGEFLDFFTQKMQISDIVERISKYI